MVIDVKDPCPVSKALRQMLVILDEGAYHQFTYSKQKNNRIYTALLVKAMIIIRVHTILLAGSSNEIVSSRQATKFSANLLGHIKETHIINFQNDIMN